MPDESASPTGMAARSIRRNRLFTIEGVAVV
jgi:hypothetical protein